MAERFGSRHYGAINGSMSTLIALAQTVAPLSVGFLRVATGDYAVALLVLAGTAVVAALAVLKARPPRQPAAAGA